MGGGIFVPFFVIKLKVLLQNSVTIFGRQGSVVGGECIILFFFLFGLSATVSLPMPPLPLFFWICTIGQHPLGYDSRLAVAPRLEL